MIFVKAILSTIFRIKKYLLLLILIPLIMLIFFLQTARDISVITEYIENYLYEEYNIDIEINFAFIQFEGISKFYLYLSQIKTEINMDTRLKIQNLSLKFDIFNQSEIVIHGLNIDYKPEIDTNSYTTISLNHIDSILSSLKKNSKSNPISDNALVETEFKTPSYLLNSKPQDLMLERGEKFIFKQNKLYNKTLLMFEEYTRTVDNKIKQHLENHLSKFLYAIQSISSDINKYIDTKKKIRIVNSFIHILDKEFNIQNSFLQIFKDETVEVLVDLRYKDSNLRFNLIHQSNTQQLEYKIYSENISLDFQNRPYLKFLHGNFTISGILNENKGFKKLDFNLMIENLTSLTNQKFIDIDGSLEFTKDSRIIKLNHAHIKNANHTADISVKHLVCRLHDVNCTVELELLNLNLEQFLMYISHKFPSFEIEHLSKLSLSGIISGYMNIAINLDDFKIDLDAKINNITFYDKNKRFYEINGISKILYNNNIITVNTENFKLNDSNIPTGYASIDLNNGNVFMKIDGSTKTSLLEQFRVRLFEYIQGDATISLVWKITNYFRDSSLNLSFNSENATVNLPYIVTDSNKKRKLKGSFIMDYSREYSTFSIRNLSLKGDDTHVKIDNIRIENKEYYSIYNLFFEVDNTKFMVPIFVYDDKVTLYGKSKDIHIKENIIDRGSIKNTSSKESVTSKIKSSTKMNLMNYKNKIFKTFDNVIESLNYLFLDIGKIHFGDKSISNIKFDVKKDNSLKKLQLNYLDEELSLLRNFDMTKLYISNIAKLLNLFNIKQKKLSGGEVTLTTQNRKRFNLQINEMTIKNLGILVSLLMATSITGIPDALINNGITFGQSNLILQEDSNQFIIEDMSLIGLSVGILGKGRISNDGIINIEGKLYPFYFFNNLFEKIPLINNFFVHDKHGGVMSITYKIHGPFSDLSIRGRPWDIIIPDFLK